MITENKEFAFLILAGSPTDAQMKSIQDMIERGYHYGRNCPPNIEWGYDNRLTELGKTIEC